MMQLLVIGGTGQVGEELKTIAASRGVRTVAPGRDLLNLASEGQIARWMEAEPWGAVINAAAYTRVDAAEHERAAAWEVNANGPGRLAAIASRRGIPLIHLSTDYVFDGRKGRPYVEADTVGPLNVYGESKEAGERAVRAANPRHIILRTSWVYSPIGTNFVKTILRLAREQERLTVVSDQKGCPTAARDIARACFELACRIASDPERARYGTYHFAGGGQATWFELATAVFELARGRTGRVPDLVPIASSDYPTAAHRPMDSRLNCDAIARDWDLAPPPWETGLQDTLDRLLMRSVSV
jgi:dTDP-4-dehydrorhamnose reductase